MLVALALMNPHMSPLRTLFAAHLQWLNDIENDPAYRSWPSGVQELLRATFPGVIRQIRRNFFNLVSPPGNQEQRHKCTSHYFVSFHSAGRESFATLQQSRMHVAFGYYNQRG